MTQGKQCNSYKVVWL